MGNILRQWMCLAEDIMASADSEDWSSRLWLHYTDHPMLTLNQKGFHQDPLGIYFFPSEHPPKYPVWHEKTYKFTAKLKPEAHVLYLPHITDTELDAILRLTGARGAFDNYIEQYPPATHRDKVRMAWEMMRMHFMRSVPVAWTKAFLKAGWDAIYDDSGIIHSAEPQQLLVLNPRMIKLVEVLKQKLPVWDALNKVVKDVSKSLEEYGPVQIEGPARKQKPYSRDTQLQADLSVHLSDKNYVRVRIFYSDEPRYRTVIHASLVYSYPSLGYGCQATYSLITGQYENHAGLAELSRALDKIFPKLIDDHSEHRPEPVDNYG